MKICKISFGNKHYDLNDKVNIITGYTGKNKTLLFYAFEYLFCIDSTLDIKLAKKQLNTDYISAEFKNDVKVIVLKRNFSSNFNAYINDTNYMNMTKYKKALAEIFNFKEIYIENGNKKNQFYLKDYLKIIFIPEEQLTSPKNIFERNGELEKNKIQMFFQYMLTGDTISEELIKKKTGTKKSSLSISSFITTYNRIYSKPKKTEIKKYEELIKRIDVLKKDLVSFNEQLDNNMKELNLINTSSKRLMILLNSYNQELKEYGFAEIFEQIEENIEDNISKIDYEYYSAINAAIEDITKVKKFTDSKLEKLLSDNEKINHKINDLNNELNELKIRLNDFDNIVRYNDMIAMTTGLINANENEILKIDDNLNKENAKIKTDFSMNIQILCNNILTRIQKWGIEDIVSVGFDKLNYDFLFNDKPIKIQPKGEKSIFSLATNIEIILFMKKIGIVVPNFIIIDSCWVTSHLSYITQDQLKNKIVDNLSQMKLQVLILENEDRKKRIENCHYITL